MIRLLHEVFRSGSSPFAAVIVVDSLGSGRIGHEIHANGWTVTYHNADRNLGSAGNLALRLQLAAATTACWCYAVNHDGEVDVRKVEKLVARAESQGDKVGAIYPRLSFSRRGDTLDAARRALSPHGAFTADTGEVTELTNVLWSSSNCALYNLSAVRDGVRVWDDLWMGWEDLAYGWQLFRAGWGQVLCGDVTVIDSYEYRPVRFLGRSIYITDKPSWYVYYQIRNLILIARRSHWKAVGRRAIVRRAITELIVTLLYRTRKGERLRLLLRGWRDGLAGRTGQGEVP